MRRAFVLVLAALLAPGCLGLDHVFPDESTAVEALRVNAYEKSREDARVEIAGLSPDNATHAFRGHVRVALERQHNGTTEPTYSPVRSWDVDVTPGEFANPGSAPLYTLVISRDTFLEAGTYRILADATVAGRALHGEALFDAEAA